MPRKKKSSPAAARPTPVLDTRVPDKVRDALVEVTGFDEAEITFDALLASDLGMDAIDIVEACMKLGVEDDSLIDDARTVYVADLVKAYGKAA